MFSSTLFFYVLTIALSFSIGFLYYYVMTSDTNKEKRAHLDLVSSQLINFILYIWLAKILLRLPTFIKDPLAVLAYPSNSHGFYMATVFILIHLYMKYRNKKAILQNLLQTFIPVFIVANFIFEFIQTVVIGTNQNWPQLIFYMILTVLYTILKGKVTEKFLQTITILLWLTGMIGLTFISTVSIFNYLIGIIYFIGLSILAFRIIIYSSNKINK